MGEINKDDVVDILQRANPRVGLDMIIMYADSFVDYQEAQANIAKNGNVVAHPRTGSPIENPYIKIKSNAMSQLLKLQRVQNVSDVWKLYGPIPN